MTDMHDEVPVSDLPHFMLTVAVKIESEKFPMLTESIVKLLHEHKADNWVISESNRGELLEFYREMLDV